MKDDLEITQKLMKAIMGRDISSAKSIEKEILSNDKELREATTKAQDSLSGTLGGFAVPTSITNTIFSEASEDQIFEKAIMTDLEFNENDVISINTETIVSRPNRSSAITKEIKTYKSHGIEGEDVAQLYGYSNTIFQQKGSFLITSFMNSMKESIREHLIQLFLVGNNSLISLTNTANRRYVDNVTPDSITKSFIQNMIEDLGTRYVEQNLIFIGNRTIKHGISRSVTSTGGGNGSSLNYLTGQKGNMVVENIDFITNNFLNDTFVHGTVANDVSTISLNADGSALQNGTDIALFLVDKTKIVVSKTPVRFDISEHSGFLSDESFIKAYYRVGCSMLSYNAGGSEYASVRTIRASV